MSESDESARTLSSEESDESARILFLGKLEYSGQGSTGQGRGGVLWAGRRWCTQVYYPAQVPPPGYTSLYTRLPYTAAAPPASVHRPALTRTLPEVTVSDTGVTVKDSGKRAWSTL